MVAPPVKAKAILKDVGMCLYRYTSSLKEMASSCPSNKRWRVRSWVQSHTVV
jgi:hypothetical protein